MTSSLRVLLTALCLLMHWLGTAQAERRLAMVIGNGEYEFATSLKNPANDAAAMAAALERLGFEVLLGTDLTHAGMRALIRDFGAKAADADVGLFFYAGHGIQVAGKNYMLPVDADLETENDLDFAAIDADLIQRQLDRGPTTRLIFLDACRDNPFERPLARSMGATRSARALGRGLARIEATGGALVAFATDPGDVAADGTGQNSPFTDALLRHIETPELEINVMLTRVRAEVFEKTKAKQRPWTSSSLIGEVYLVPKGSTVVVTPPNATPNVANGAALEIALWTSAERGGTAADYRAYLGQFPDGSFAELARNRLAALTPAVQENQAEARPEPAPDSETGSVPETVTPQSPLSPEEAEEQLALDRAARRTVQERLSVAGFDPRGLDGIFGPGTRGALRSWQGKAGREATGFLSAEDLAVLETETDSGLAAFRAEQKRRAEAAAAAARKRKTTSGTQRTNTSGSSGLYRATSSCRTNGVSATARHADRQQAMLAAARACAAKGGAPSCCTANISVSR